MLKGEEFQISIPEQLNLGSYFIDVNLEAGRADKTALYYAERSYSFRELSRLINKLGNVLKGLGVEPEDRVMLVMEDCPEWLAAWLGTIKIGAVATNAYTFLQPHDYEYLFDLIRPKLVIADEATLAKIRQARGARTYPKAVLVAGEDLPELQRREIALKRLTASAEDSLEAEPTHRDDIAYWNFSSGTTGKPKGVPHMHRDGLVNFESFQRWQDVAYRSDDIVLRVPKLFFHYARDGGCLLALRGGAAVVLYRQKATAALLFELIRKHRPTILVNVPTMMRAMIQMPEAERADVSCLRYSMSSGEPLSASLCAEWLEAFGVPPVDKIGSAEAGIAYLSNRPSGIVPGSSGTVSPLVQVKLVDPEGSEVPQGQPGVLMTRSDASAQYYVREHEQSKKTFPGDDWIYTGDVFVQDERGYFWFVGRANDMVKVSGVWVSPAEIERGLQEHPCVKECAALPLQDKDNLTKVKAFVVLAEGASASVQVLQEELKRFCQEKLAPHKRPRDIEFMDELPKTGQGKIDRRLLRERGF